MGRWEIIAAGGRDLRAAAGPGGESDGLTRGHRPDRARRHGREPRPQVVEERGEPRRSPPPALGPVPANGQVRVDEGAEKPGPGAPLVIRGVPLRRTALEAATVVGVSGVERAKPVRGEEPLLDREERPLGPLPGDEGPVEREGEELVGAEREIARSVGPDDVGEPAEAFVPEERREALPGLVGDREEAGRREGVSEVGGAPAAARLRTGTRDPVGPGIFPGGIVADALHRHGGEWSLPGGRILARGQGSRSADRRNRALG